MQTSLSIKHRTRQHRRCQGYPTCSDVKFSSHSCVCCPPFVGQSGEIIRNRDSPSLDEASDSGLPYLASCLLPGLSMAAYERSLPPPPREYGRGPPAFDRIQRGGPGGYSGPQPAVPVPPLAPAGPPVPAIPPIDREKVSPGSLSACPQLELQRLTAPLCVDLPFAATRLPCGMSSLPSVCKGRFACAQAGLMHSESWSFYQIIGLQQLYTF